jgi:hypothetical protein
MREQYDGYSQLATWSYILVRLCLSAPIFKSRCANKGHHLVQEGTCLANAARVFLTCVLHSVVGAMSARTSEEL